MRWRRRSRFASARKRPERKNGGLRPPGDRRPDQDRRSGRLGDAIEECWEIAPPGAVVFVEGVLDPPSVRAKIALKSIRLASAGEYKHDELAEAPPSQPRASGGPAAN